MLFSAHILLLCTLRLSGVNGEEGPSGSDANGGHNFTTLLMQPQTAITSQGNVLSSEQMQMTTPTTPVTSEPLCFTSSCSGRCGKKFRYFSKAPCSCDKDCPLFKDCCKDFISLCRNETEGLLPGDALPRPSSASYFSCVHYRDDHSLPAYMVTKCPGGYKNQIVKEFCEENPQNLLILYVPVTEKGGDYVYRNLYCAICHSLDIRKLQHFYIHYRCISNDTQFKEYIKQKPFADITLNDTMDGCSVKLIETRAVRNCVDAHLESCGKPAAINDACAAYMDPVTLTLAQPSGAVQTVTARNKDCVQCSNLTEFLLSWKCWTKPVGTYVNPFYGFPMFFNIQGIDIPDESLTSLRTTYPNTGVIQGHANLSLTEEVDEIFLTFLLTNPNKDESKPSDVLANLSKILVFKDITLIECVQLGASEVRADKRNFTTAYKINTTLRYDLLRLIELFGTYAWNQAGGRNISGILRNTRRPIEDVCLSPTRYYQEKEFYERLKSKTIKLNVPLQLKYPVEIVWAGSKVHGSFSNCPDFAKFTFTEEISFPIFKVCGDTLEQNCQLTTYDVKDVSTAVVYSSLFRLTKTFLYQTEGVIATCGEIFTEQSIVVFYITVVGCSLSTIGLALDILTFGVFEKLRNSTGLCDLNFICALFMTQCLFGVGEVVAWRNAYVCQAVAVMQHFFWLGTFSWTNVMAFDLARTVREKTAIPPKHKERRRLVQYMLVAWGLPLVVVTTSVTLNYTDAVSVLYGELGICWILDKYALLAFFVAPVTLHVLFNVGCFSCSVYNIRMISRLADGTKALSERRSQMGVYTRITAIMGVTCLIGYLSNMWHHPALLVIFLGVNSFQGFLISMNFILTSRFIKLYRGRFFANRSLVDKHHSTSRR